MYTGFLRGYDQTPGHEKLRGLRGFVGGVLLPGGAGRIKAKLHGMIKIRKAYAGRSGARAYAFCNGRECRGAAEFGVRDGARPVMRTMQASSPTNGLQRSPWSARFLNGGVRAPRPTDRIYTQDLPVGRGGRFQCALMNPTENAIRLDGTNQLHAFCNLAAEPPRVWPEPWMMYL